MLEQIENNRHGFLVGNEIGLVDFQVLDDRRDAAKSDALGDRATVARLGLAMGEQIVHAGAAGIGKPDDDVALFFTQETRDAGESAAGADGADEAVDLAVGLLPDLRAGRDVMRFGVVQVVPLVGEDGAVLFGGLELLRQPAADMLVVVRIAEGDRRNFDQFGSAQPQGIFLFLALGLRDDDQRAIAAGIGDDGKSDAGIAGGCLDNKTAGFEFAALLRFQDHLAAGAVLHRTARIHEFGLAEDGASRGGRGALELDQRRMPDGLNQAVAELHAVPTG